tara:strand:- start:383 stop:529 length:147 start_codon:yes stop_codon:yes gene_type:complete
MKKYLGKIPIKKMANHENIVEASTQFLSDVSIYVICTNLKVDEYWSAI